MKKTSQLLMQLGVVMTILIGVLLILFTNQISFKKIVKDDVENISKLTSSIIYSEIDNSLTKPIFVGLTMANDFFLKNWLTNEIPEGSSSQTALIQNYLTGYQEKYNYNSVFVVSDKSNIYYSQHGINKAVSTSNAHDVWYYSFMDSGKAYDLDVDFDEANNNQLSVFVNCLISADNGTPMGAVGVGIKMEHLQELLRQYESEYGLRAFLMDGNGVVQVDSVVKNIETVNFFDNHFALEQRDKILNNKKDLQTFWYADEYADHCLITKYVENLDWYIVIEKDTAPTQAMLTEQVNQDLIIVAAIILLVLLFISYIIGQYNHMLLQTASTDDVTNLPNRKMFQEIFAKNSCRPACRDGYVFIFDIDNFKNINDSFGHLFGNTILYRISEVSTEVVGSSGLVARWGGDEFIGVVYCGREESEKIFADILKSISAISEGELSGITASLGAAKIRAGAELDTMLGSADTAMYKSKYNGKNMITFNE